MNAALDVRRFTVPVFDWNSIGSETKGSICQLLSLDEKKTNYYFDLYFSKFYILHKIGHIIADMYDEENQTKSGRTEFCASLFAYKYLSHKNESEYLNLLTQVFSYLLKKKNWHAEIPRDNIDNYFVEMQTDIIGYILVHGQFYLECVKNKMSLKEVIECISKHNLETMNSGVILQKSISGQRLVQECLAYVFEMNKIELAVEFEQQINLNKKSLALKRMN